jgi:hypothetical protein
MLATRQLALKSGLGHVNNEGGPLHEDKIFIHQDRGSDPGIHVTVRSQMNPKLTIRIVKHRKRRVSESRAKVESVAGPKRWSTTVKSWVSEFQKHRRNDSLRAFDSLFK